MLLSSRPLASPCPPATLISTQVKVWDVRTWLCTQTFTVTGDELNSFTLTSQNKKRIICATRKLQYFEYDEPKDQLLTDEKTCLRILFNDTLLNFITLHPDSIKVIFRPRSRTLLAEFRAAPLPAKNELQAKQPCRQIVKER